MARMASTGGQVLSGFEPTRAKSLAKVTASLVGSFFFFQAMHISLIVGGKIGAGKIRAAKIAKVMSYQEEN